MSAEPAELELKLIRRIGREGKLTFRDFHKAALYDKELGYYNTERLKIGPRGDFYTSSNVHKAFGAVLSRAFIGLWEDLYKRSDEDSNAQMAFTLVELGAGTGQLAFDILTSLSEIKPEAFRKLKYLIVETSSVMIRLQREKLSGFEDYVEWRTLEELELEPVAGIVFSNELIDAMPVHRVRLDQGRLQECYVNVGANGRLRFEWGEPSTSDLIEYIERGSIRLEQGWMIEINLDVTGWLERMSRAIERGYLVTIDYGDVAGHLYSAERRKGTLRSFRNHRLVESLLDQVGEQDITASVNFTALIEYGRELGFEMVSYERQSGFLFRNGLVEIMAAQEYENDTVEDMKERLTLKNLFVPGGVSDNFRVLIQRKLSSD